MVDQAVSETELKKKQLEEEVEKYREMIKKLANKEPEQEKAKLEAFKRPKEPLKEPSRDKHKRERSRYEKTDDFKEK